MMVDIYPFQDQGGAANLFLWKLQVVRKTSLKADILYWLFIQAYIHPNRRLPSDSNIRMQMFSTLIFGFTDLAYFTYDVSLTDGLLIGGKEKSAIFDNAARANRELRNIAGPIRFLASTQVRYVKATYLVDASYLGGLLGHFQDDDGRRYFMLTNLWHS